MNRSSMNASIGLAQSRPSRPTRPGVEALEQRNLPAPLVISGATPTQLANALVGNGVTVSNVSYVGLPAASGLFSGGMDVIGFDAGIVLSTGLAADVRGPNNNDFFGTDNSQPGDATLSALSGNSTNDAASLQFDVIPQSNLLRFDFVFGSEEYNELANNAVSDRFALFVNGTNVAFIPGTMTEVSIDTINVTMNPSLYVNNALASDPPAATPPLKDTQLDGFTVPITVQAAVAPGQTNRIRLVLADVIDTSIDSALFIRAGSFSSPFAPIITTYRPLRYAFRDVDQNLGQRGPLPVQGGALQPSFDGVLTLVNIGNLSASGNAIVTVLGLPPGTTLLNANGVTSTGDPFIQLNNVTLAAQGQPLRVPIKIHNPGLVPLGTFYLGQINVDVLIG